MVDLPTPNDLLWPVLEAAFDIDQPARYEEIDALAVELAGLTNEQLAVQFPEGSSQTGPKVFHRTAWARSGLKKAGLLESTAHGYWAITQSGRDLAAMPREAGRPKLRSLVDEAYALTAPHAATLDEWAQRANSDEPVVVRVRDLLSYWGVSRRWGSINDAIRETLAERGLTTDPDFTVGALDDSVRIRTQHQADQPHSIELPTTKTPTALTIGNLPSASGGVVSVTPQDSLLKAQSLMWSNDYSQLAVMSGKRDLRTAISWESIARARLRKPDADLKDCIIEPTIVPLSAPLLDSVQRIYEAGFVFVQGSDRTITGIVTTADLSLQFAILARPFLILGEIEQLLRGVIDRSISTDKLIEFLDPDDDERVVEAAHSLTLGQIQRLFEDPSIWAKLDLPADHGVFVGSLDRVRRIRNEVMHFSPDPLEEADNRDVANFLTWMRDLES